MVLLTQQLPHPFTSAALLKPRSNQPINLTRMPPSSDFHTNIPTGMHLNKTLNNFSDHSINYSILEKHPHKYQPNASQKQTSMNLDGKVDDIKLCPSLVQTVPMNAPKVAPKRTMMMRDILDLN